TLGRALSPGRQPWMPAASACCARPRSGARSARGARTGPSRWPAPSPISPRASGFARATCEPSWSFDVPRPAVTRAPGEGPTRDAIRRSTRSRCGPGTLVRGARSRTQVRFGFGRRLRGDEGPALRGAGDVRPVPASEHDERAQVERQVRLIGSTLRERAGRVLELVHERSAEAQSELDPQVEESLSRICTIATVTVADWMSGGRPEDGIDAANEAFELFGQLAAHRAAPLHEVTKRCLRWRDSVCDVLRESAAHHGASDRARRRALAMAQATLDVTLVRMCEVFEQERSRVEEELDSRSEQLAYLSTHDQLTGLPNRTLILDRTEQMLSRARRNGGPVAALHVNLDNFTVVNDTLGHTVGDELLRGVAARLDGLVRDSDALGRLGGDDFVVVAEEASLDAGAELIAERLLEALR